MGLPILIALTAHKRYWRWIDDAIEVNKLMHVQYFYLSYYSSFCNLVS